ncbi:Outer membrane protein OprM [Burkholderiales bacterium]|nr:Outer membrane protein OprM [Burkholderiales bacterium]
MTREARRALAALALAAALAGCAVTQPRAPSVDLPEAPPPTAAELALLERWWTAFDDPALVALVDEALANNLDLASAFARIELARAQTLLAQSYLYPGVDLNVAASRSRISGVGSTPLPPGTPLISNHHGVSVDLGYELDLWGRYRSGTLAARNELAASRYFRESVRAAVASDVAIAYFRLRGADAERSLLEDTLATREDTVRLQQDRFDGGVVGEFDVRQAEAERSAVIANLARTRQGIGLLEGSLATLTGRSPRDVFAPAVARADASRPAPAVPQLPEGLPSGLLERRPDIRRAEALLAASELRIQQARAAYYPSISLTAAFGSESAALSDLFTSPASVWRFGAALLQPLIGLKGIEANVQAATARRDEAIVGYRQTVQTAFREVHDALVVHRTAREILAAETARREQLASALDVAKLRYDAGRTSYLEVLDAQRQLLAAETLRIAAARDTRIAIVSFAKALGGGWEPASLADAMPR